MMGQGGFVQDIQRTPSGMIASSERGVRYWDGVPSLVEPAGAAGCTVTFSVVARDRPVIGLICAEKKMEMYDGDTRTASVIPEPRDDFVTTIDPSGHYLANWDWLGVIRLWTVGGKSLGELKTKEVMSVGWVGGKLWILMYVRGSPEKDDFYGELVEVDPATHAQRTLPWVPRQPTLVVQELAGGRGAMVYDEKGSLILLAPDGTEVKRVVTELEPGHTFAPIASATTGGGHAVVGGTGAVKVYKLPELTEVRRIDTSGAAVVTASLSPDGSTLITTAVDHRSSVWSVATGEVITPLTLGEVAIYEAAFTGSPDRLMVFAGEYPYLMKLPRATGDAKALAAEIGCRVPLRPEGGALVPTKPTCP
jgi:WD40 repeat protein